MSLRALNELLQAQDRVLSSWRRLSPSTLFVTSFAVLVAVCAAGLMFLPGLYTGARLGSLDALFTATSAVCVTGLIVVDTATFFTFWGQLWLLLFIQLGGLGLITLTTLIIRALGFRLSLRSEMLALPGSPREGAPDVGRIAFTAAKFTLAWEALGALLLWPQFMLDFAPVQAAWHAVFQAVSAFCNAGFSTFSSSLVGYQSQVGVPLTISILVVLGGLGYLTGEELLRWWRARKSQRPLRLSSHSFGALTTTAGLLLLGTLLFTIFEWDGVLRDLGVVDKLVNGWFMSVTARTAGFNTISYAEVGNDSAFFTILLMIVGGSPGSMAGGIKTTTVAILVALALARVRGRRHVELHDRTLPNGTVERTVSLVLITFSLVTISVFLLNVSAVPSATIAAERASALPTIFEVVSAIGTVGLSMDMTPSLGAVGKVLITVLMFLGRVGPLSFFAAVSFKTSSVPKGMRAAHEDVIVG